jgi:hypothetical protein
VSFQPVHFIDDPVQVEFDVPPVHEKSPTCPNRFSWEGRLYQITEKLAEWQDFERRGRMAQNMSPAHSSAAARRGSWGVGRFFFRVKTDQARIFDLYYDRSPRNADDRKGSWVIYRELEQQRTPDP